jgi:hypothetical protein
MVVSPPPEIIITAVLRLRNDGSYAFPNCGQRIGQLVLIESYGSGRDRSWRLGQFCVVTVRLPINDDGTQLRLIHESITDQSWLMF